MYHKTKSWKKKTKKQKGRPQTAQFSSKGDVICRSLKVENQLLLSWNDTCRLGSPQFKSLCELKVLQILRVSDILMFEIKYK